MTEEAREALEEYIKILHEVWSIVQERGQENRREFINQNTRKKPPKPDEK